MLKFKFLERFGGSRREIELQQAKMRLGRLKIEEVMDDISKQCWEFNIQYEVIIKNDNVLNIVLKTGEESNMLQYHKQYKIYASDYHRFLNYTDFYKVKRATYITTGTFDEKVEVCSSGALNKRNILLVDGDKLIKYQRKFFRLGDICIGTNFQLILYKYL